MNRLSTERRAQIIGCLAEGNSIRASVRMTGAAKNTVTKLLVDLGAACAEYQDRVMVELPCRTLQCDEIWAFCYSKQKNVPDEHVGTVGYGDVWTWTAICADTKLVPSWLVGERTTDDAYTFMCDLQARLANRVQLTTDGYRCYLKAVEGAFENEIDFAMLHKIYGPPAGQANERRYSPAVVQRNRREGHPGRPRPVRDFHQLRRTAEPHDADGDAPLHPPDQRLLGEGREPRARRQPPLHALQLCASPPVARDRQRDRPANKAHPRDGRRSRRTHLDAP